MTTALLKTKHDKLFDLLDYDGNGAIELADFEQLAADLVKAGTDNPHAQSAEAVFSAYRRAFERFAAHADTDRDGTIDRDEFHAAMATQADREARVDDIWGPTCDVEFDNVDVDGDGKLDRDEFATLMAGFGQTPVAPLPGSIGWPPKVPSPARRTTRLGRPTSAATTSPRARTP